MSYLEVVDMVFDHYKFTRKAKNRPYIKPKGPQMGVVVPGSSPGKPAMSSLEENKVNKIH